MVLWGMNFFSHAPDGFFVQLFAHAKNISPVKGLLARRAEEPRFFNVFEDENDDEDEDEPIISGRAGCRPPEQLLRRQRYTG